MAAALAEGPATLKVGSIELDIEVAGNGRPILFLSSGLWIADETPFIAELARLGQVIAPLHPFFGPKPGPAAFTGADDLAYLYLDLLDHLDLGDVLLVGAGFGGWIAAQMAIKNCERLSGLALIDRVVDVFATTDDDLERFAFADPSRFHFEAARTSDEGLTSRMRRREATARYVWSPYMHDPRLKDRLHRIRIPSVVMWGEADRIVKPDYGRHFAGLIPGARFETIPQAGHFPHLERPAIVLEHLSALARRSATQRL